MTPAGGAAESLRPRSGQSRPPPARNLQEAPIYIDDTAGITVLEIKAKTRRLKARHPNLALVVIDYLQLMSGGARIENR